MLTHARTAVTVVLGLFAINSAEAAQVISLSFNQLVDRADVIILGHVVGATAERPTHNARRIRTRVKVGVHEVLKWNGKVPSPNVIDVFVPGGEVGRFGQKVPGAPRLRQGDRVLLHLRFSQRGELQVMGLAQGCQHVEEYKGTLHAVRHNEGIHYVARSTNGLQRGKELNRLPIEREPLSPLLQRIRARISQPFR